MAKSTEFQSTPPHIAFFPSAEMGHLIPLVSLAAKLVAASPNCTVSLLIVQPTVSAAQSAYISNFFSVYPNVRRLDFHILPFETHNDDEPYSSQLEAIDRSLHLLPPVLTSLPQPLCAIFSDMMVAASGNQIATDLGIPNYVVCPISARCYSFIAYFPILMAETPTKLGGESGHVEVPGLAPFPKSSIPSIFLSPNHPFTTRLLSNARSLIKAKGVLMNSFNWVEQETIAALNNGRILSNLPPVFPIGPLEPYGLKRGHHLPFLDVQRAESVVYVSFGSRTVMPKDQILELGKGLESSGLPFFWVINSSKVDEGDDEDLQELLGNSFLERTKNRGMVVKGWADQGMILKHPAIGGFVTHCGWNSLMEAAQRGLPVLKWPQNGDQRINAEAAEKAGFGMWERNWDWCGGILVKGEEIAEKVREMMGNVELREKARKVGEEARKAGGVGGSSEEVLIKLIEML